jgi:Haem-degrading
VLKKNAKPIAVTFLVHSRLFATSLLNFSIIVNSHLRTHHRCLAIEIVHPVPLCCQLRGEEIDTRRVASWLVRAEPMSTLDAELGALHKTRPDRYFGIMNMYPGKIYLVGGGVPLAVDSQLVGGVGVAGLPEGVDEKSARAGIAAWMKLRETMKK